MFRSKRVLTMVNIRPSALARLFSSSALTGREFAHVVGRKVKQLRVPQVGDPDTILPSQAPNYPKYPYGPSLIYKQSNRGLYGGKFLQFGNKISEKFNQKSGRIFYPNVQKTQLWSESLKRQISVKLVASVLRTITKEGGLDSYLTKDSPARIKELGPYGWRLRFDVLKKLQEIERTQPKPLPGLKVGKARLVKDLFQKDNEETTFKEFRLKYGSTDENELLQKLESFGVDISIYKACLNQPTTI